MKQIKEDGGLPEDGMEFGGDELEEVGADAEGDFFGFVAGEFLDGRVGCFYVSLNSN